MSESLIQEVMKLQAIAAEYRELMKELEDNYRHLSARSASYRHGAADDSFEDGKARAYSVAASDISFTIERSQRRVARNVGTI